MYVCIPLEVSAPKTRENEADAVICTAVVDVHYHNW